MLSAELWSIRVSVAVTPAPAGVVWSSLTTESAKTLVHAFVSSWLDYCNSLLYGVSDELLLKISRSECSHTHGDRSQEVGHITPVLHGLHCIARLPARTRFNLAMTVYKCLSGFALAYLAAVADDCTQISPVASIQHLRSAGTCKCQLVLHKIRTLLDARLFAGCSTVVWNSAHRHPSFVAKCCNVCRSRTLKMQFRGMLGPLQSIGFWGLGKGVSCAITDEPILTVCTS